MKVTATEHKHDRRRVVRLDMTAESFEEERILTAVLNAMRSGGKITASTPTSDGENVTVFAFQKFDRI